MIVSDLINLAMKDAGILGVGQNLLSEDANDALVRLNLLLAQWRRKRWLVNRLTDLSFVSTGAQSYTVGPAGNYILDPRPDKIEAAYVRQLWNVNPALQPDTPLRILNSREDYSRLALKQMGPFPSLVWYDAAYPVGVLYPWPVPQVGIYEVHILVKDVLSSALTLTTSISLPDEYIAALMYNLGVRLRIAYRMPPDPALQGLAREALNVIRTSNGQIPVLQMPSGLPGGSSVYNPYSDRMN